MHVPYVFVMVDDHSVTRESRVIFASKLVARLAELAGEMWEA